AAHLKLSYDRVAQEKEILEQQIVQVRNEAVSFKAKVSHSAHVQIEEQLEIHNHTRASLEKSQSLCHAQQERIKDLEREIDELNVDFYKKQIQELQHKLSSVSAELKSEILEKQALVHHQDQIKENMKQSAQKQGSLEQEVAHLKLALDREQQLVRQRKSRNSDETRAEQDFAEQKLQMENEIKMLNIACESKNRLIEDLNQKIKSIELAQLKSAEQAMARKERLDQVEQLARSRAHELIQIGQDKSMLQDELADAKNHQDRNEKRLKTLQAQNNALETKLEQYQKEAEQYQELSGVMGLLQSIPPQLLELLPKQKKNQRPLGSTAGLSS
ncbi:hypothetical protein HDU91_002500, partial [Kappamyces sp. JEL0680]